MANGITIEQLQELKKNPYIAAALDMIAASEIGSAANEAGGGYDVMFGFDRASDLSQHPGKKTTYTDPSTGKQVTTSAAGRFQIIGPTAKSISQRLGLKDFSPESQELMALYLIVETGAADDLMRGDLQSAMGKLGTKWAALPGSSIAHSPDQTRSWEFAYGKFNDALRKHAGGQPVQMAALPAGLMQSQSQPGTPIGTAPVNMAPATTDPATSSFQRMYDPDFERRRQFLNSFFASRNGRDSIAERIARRRAMFGPALFSGDKLSEIANTITPATPAPTAEAVTPAPTGDTGPDAVQLALTEIAAEQAPEPAPMSPDEYVKGQMAMWNAAMDPAAMMGAMSPMWTGDILKMIDSTKVDLQKV